MDEESRTTESHDHAHSDAAHEIHDPDLGMKVKCLSCGSPQEGFFCGDCHTLLPFGTETDYFAFMGMERRPVLDEEKLREAFLALSQKVHPDRHFDAVEEVRDASLDHAAFVNRAYQTLKDPRERLKYLLTLETGEEPKETSKASMETMGFYMEAGEVCHEAEAYLKAQAAGGTADPARITSLLTRLRDFKQQAHVLWQDALKQLSEVDREWMGRTSGVSRTEMLPKISLLANDLSYLSKLRLLIDQQILSLS